MEVSDRGREEIVAHEGVVLRPYKDVVGVWTIGVGHTKAAGGPDPVKLGKITRERAMQIFTDDLVKFEKRTLKAFTVKLLQSAFDGAVSFDFNTGAIHRATWVKKFNKGAIAAARKSFMDWRKPAAIIGRRTKEMKLFFDGVYSSGGEGNQRKLKKAKPLTPDPVVKEAQELLTARGFDLGAIDGWMGRKTKAAIQSYQQQHPHLENDGILGPATLSQLRRDAALASEVVKKAVTPSVVGAGGAGAVSDHMGFDWLSIGIAAGGITLVALIAYVAWRNRDLIERRLNKMFGNSVA
ncbi:glycoside hydrolase family protein [Lentilitoribacter sp. EG35]|uniref:glycoside hydrolase family protein n=1 Tax=Lentilitoribacter sp. EG35 TaxID=3234192 RepID=UPI0034602C59